jgi:hypothetical protein
MYVCNDIEMNGIAYILLWLIAYLSLEKANGKKYQIYHDTYLDIFKNIMLFPKPGLNTASYTKLLLLNFFLIRTTPTSNTLKRKQHIFSGGELSWGRIFVGGESFLGTNIREREDSYTCVILFHFLA